MRPVISLTTDFGTQDRFVGTMKGVIAGICPDANVIDNTHEIPAFDISTRPVRVPLPNALTESSPSI